MSDNSPRPRFFGWFIFLVITGLALAGFYKMRHMGNAPKGAGMAPPPPKVIAQKPIKKMISQIYEEIGQAEAINITNVVARIEGELLKRKFVEGSTVEQGETLFLIEQDKYAAELDQAMASFKTATAEQIEATNQLSRLEKTMKEAVSKTEMDAALSAKRKADADLDTAKAAIRIAKLNLDYTTIKAPITGKIGRANITEGNVVNPQSGTLATIVQTSPIYATFAIGEDKALSMNSSGRSKDFSDIDVELVLSNGKKFPHKGKIVFMDNVVNDTAGTVLMRATFPNPEGILIPGQFVDLRIEPQTKVERLLVPEAAIMQDQSGNFVLVVNGENIVKRQTVTLGRKIGLYKVVETGIKADDKIIYKGMEKSRPGSPVTPTIEKMEEEAPKNKKADKE